MGSQKIVSNQMKDSVNLPKGKSTGQLGKRPIVNLSQEFSKLTAFIGTFGVVAFGVGIASYGAHSGWWPAGPLSNLSKLYTIHVLQIGGGVSLLTPLGAGAWGILEISHRHLSRSQKEVQVKRPNAKTKTLTEQPQTLVQGKQKENPKTENASLNIQTKETAKHRQVASIERGAHPIQRKSPSKLLRSYSEQNLTQRKIGRTFSSKRSVQMMPLTGAFVEKQGPSAKIKASLNSLLDAPSINPESVAAFLKTFPGTPTAQDLSNDQGINLVNVLLKKISLSDSVDNKNDALLAIFYIILGLNPDHPFKIDDPAGLEAPWVQTQEDGVYLTTRREFFKNEKIGRPILNFIEQKHPTFFSKPYLFDRKQPECYLIQMGARLCQPWLVDFCTLKKLPYFSSEQSANPAPDIKIKIDNEFSELMKSIGNRGDIKRMLNALLNFYGIHCPGAVPPPLDLYNVISMKHTKILKAFFEIVFFIDKNNKTYNFQDNLILEALSHLHNLADAYKRKLLKTADYIKFYERMQKKDRDMYSQIVMWFKLNFRDNDAAYARKCSNEVQAHEILINPPLYKCVLNTVLRYSINDVFIYFISKNKNKFVINSVIKENVIPFKMIRGTSILHVAAKLKKEHILVAFVKDPKFFNNLSIVNSRDESGKSFLHYLDKDPERLSTMVEEFINENPDLSWHLDDTLKAELSETLRLPIGEASDSALSWVESL